MKKSSSVVDLLKRITCLFVAYSLIINLSTPAFAQAVSNGRKAAFLAQAQERLDKVLREKTYTAVQESTAFVRKDTARRMFEQAEKMDSGDLTPQDSARLFAIDELLTPTISAPQGKPEDVYDSFRKEFSIQAEAELKSHLAKVEEIVTSSRADLAARAAHMKQSGQYDPAQVDEWTRQNESLINQWAAEQKSQLSKWESQQDELARESFEALEKDSLVQLEQEVKSAVKDLFALQDKAPVAKRKLVSHSVRILPLSTLEGKSFFTPQQKQELRDLYVSVLNSNLRCTDKCEQALSAVMGLGMVGDSGQDAQLIVEFMEAQREGVFSVPALLTGTSALLAMKQYRTLRGFLASATEKERDISNIDFFSLKTLVDVFKNINGSYLGEVSKHAVYPITKDTSEEAPVANAWEDVALMLAAEGSPESLALLKEFGVDRCVAWVDKDIKLRSVYKVGCSGIRPFLAGALESGKSGAEKYLPYASFTQPGDYISNNGVRVISPEQARTNRQLQEEKRQTFQKYVSLTGLDAAGALARHLFNQSMGDLNADSELALDRKLFAVYEKSAKTHPPHPGYEITAYEKGSPQYNAKRVRQDRTRWWLTAAKYGDIAILVWCLVDISKLLVKGGKMGHALYKMMQMSRRGATSAERVFMLRRLKMVSPIQAMRRRIPQRIRKGMEPVVLAQRPQFMSTPALLKVPGGAIPKPAQLVAKNLQFSAQTGVLAVNTGKAASAQPSAAKMMTVLDDNQIAGINASLAAAVERTNLSFANRSQLARLMPVSADAAYRKALAQEIVKLPALPGFKSGEMFSLADQVRRMPTIKVPQNIEAFKQRSLLNNGKLDLQAVGGLLVKTLGAAPTAEQTVFVKELFSAALEKTNQQFANRGWFRRLFTTQSSYKNTLMSNLAQAMDADRHIFTDAAYGKIGQSLLAAVNNDKSIKAPASLKEYHGVPLSKEKREYKQMGASVLWSSDPTVTPRDIPLNVLMETGIPGVRANQYQRVVFTDKKAAYLFGVGNDLSKAFQPTNFKITLSEKQIPQFIAAAEKAAPAKPFELKLLPNKEPGFWYSLRSGMQNRWHAFQAARAETGKTLPLKNVLFRDKQSMFAHTVPVLRRTENGNLVAVPLSLRADTYLGLKNAQMVLEPSGALNFYREGKLLSGVAPFSYGVRKTELKPFLEIVRHAPEGLRFDMKVKSTRSKLVPLFVATGLSLSSASSSLIAPLENIYGKEITETDKTLISLALPYIPSLLTPVFSPLVMKIGALKSLKMALGTAFGGLMFASAFGFAGKVNEEHLPPIWPLFVSGAAIGLSSALNRSGLNLLIDRIGGGGSLLKSMAFKNLGAMAMLLPPIVANFFAPGATDFSLAFPVLGVISAGSLASLYFSRIDPNIGKAPGFMKFIPMHGNLLKRGAILAQNSKILLRDGWRETWGSLRILASKELLPLTAAAFAFTGFEAATFNKAANQLIRPEVTEFEWINNIREDNRKNWIALVTSGTVVLFPLLTRLGAKPLLQKMADPARVGAEYQRMLKLSYALNIGGAALMMHYGFEGFTSPGFIGIAMVGVGTANVTQSLQKLANINVVRGGYVAARTAGKTAAEAAVIRDKAATTAMTVFSLSQTGLAAVPLMVSHYTDNHIREGIEKSEDVPRTSLWMPLTSIGTSVAFAGGSLGLLPKTLPVGLMGLSKGIIGSYPQAFRNTWEVFRPAQVAPYGVPAWFNPLPAYTPQPEPLED